MKRNSKSVLVMVITALAGCLLGSLVDLPGNMPEYLRADIGKLNRYKKEVVSERSMLIVDQLKSDEDFRNQTVNALTLVAAQAGDLRAVAVMAIDASHNLEGFEEAGKEMQKIQFLAQNAASNAYTALAVVEAALKGQKYELQELLNNALLSFMFISKKAPVVKQFAQSVDAYLEGKEVEDYEDLALVRDLCVGFGLMNAYYNADSEEMEQWERLGALLPPGEAIRSYKSLSRSQRAKLALSATMMDVLEQTGSSSSQLPLFLNPDVQQAQVLLDSWQETGELLNSSVYGVNNDK